MRNKTDEQKRIEKTAAHKVKKAKTTRQGTFGAASACRSLSDDEIMAWVAKNLHYLKNNTREMPNRHK